jgi:membrane dipeptidase
MTRAILFLLAAIPLAGPLRAQDQWRHPDPGLLARARALLRTVPLIEGHNDLPTRLLEVAGGDLHRADLTLRQEHLPADIPRLREGMVGAQFWAAYVHSDSMDTGAALRQGLREIDMIHRVVGRYDDLVFASTADDIERIFADGRIASLIGVEGGHAIENSLSALRLFYQLGVRYMTLTHWRTTDWVDAATDEPRHGGLSPFGEEVIGEMNRLGMFVDISHVSAETMRDVLRVSTAPVIFSHSSARAVNAHPRNVPDDVLSAMRENGGVVMVNFYAGYVPPSGPAWEARRDSVAASARAASGDAVAIAARVAAWERAHPRPRGTLSDVADHIDHMRAVAGVDHVGIGADYYDEGGPSMAEGLDDLTRFPHLFAELLRRGYSDEDVRKIAGLNFLRAMRGMERTARELQRATSPSLADLGRN